MRAELPGIFKALSDETRLRILKLLEGGELCVCQIVAALAMSQPRASFHLAVLREAGLIRDRKAGRWSHYRLEDSEAFRRFLLLAVLERAKGGVFEKDKGKLKALLDKKTPLAKGLIKQPVAGKSCL